ncbi:hypothetical protein [Mesoterricola silvestris]|uniref:Uncharacterized protein n=1 Tax=Mesoterricola silvestris TaxID=2927979 RepID=A0AA48KAT5_9BACT|nr:hypothetical protein [Mesoterricola silvestris]BDU75036.1 hypothetical protein METEAL_42100 [Mesoterricola silvestris]
MEEPSERETPHGVDPDAWKAVVMGQASRDLVAPHPEPAEAPEDELEREALTDPAARFREEHDPQPTLWRVVVLVVVAVAALSVVFGLTR